MPKLPLDVLISNQVSYLKRNAPRGSVDKSTALKEMPAEAEGGNTQREIMEEEAKA